MSSYRAAFAVPGDIRTLTGGYIYDRQLVDGLSARGWDMSVISLSSSFPYPDDKDMADAARRLADLPADCPVIVDGLALGALDVAALKDVQAPIVAMVHHPLACEAGLHPAYKAFFLSKERDALACASHVLVPSAHTAAMLAANYSIDPAQITVARPGTETRKQERAPMDPPLILSVGIQVPRKGHDVLLHALALIKDSPWQAVIVGGVHDEKHAAELETLTGVLGLGERVMFAGRMEADDLSDLYARASLFALATRYEGYGIVFNEAMSFGLPIISCDTGAVPDTVAVGAGLLVQPDDPDGFGAALRTVLADHALRERMRKVSQRAGEALPGWAHTVDLAERVLRGVQEGALPPSPSATPPRYFGKDEAPAGPWP